MELNSPKYIMTYFVVGADEFWDAASTEVIIIKAWSGILTEVYGWRPVLDIIEREKI